MARGRDMEGSVSHEVVREPANLVCVAKVTTTGPPVIDFASVSVAAW